MKSVKNRKKKWITILIVLFIFVAAGYIIFNNAIRPVVLSLAETKLESLANQSVNDAIDETFSSNVSYSDLVIIEKDENGAIKSLSAKTANIDKLASEVSLAVQNKIKNIGQQGIDIPIGTVIGGPLFTGRGPCINVRFEPVGTVNTDFLTSFESAGINQTRHLIYLAVYVDLKIVVDNTVEQVDYSSRLLIADTVIVGEIPQEYMQFDNPDGLQSLAPMLLMDQYSEE